MNIPLLTPLAWIFKRRISLNTALLSFCFLTIMNAQVPCGTPSPLSGVPEFTCVNETDTFTISPFNALTNYQLFVSPPGGITINNLTPGYPGFEVLYGGTPGNYTFYYQENASCTDTFYVHITDRFAPQVNINDTVNVSLDENCMGRVYPTMVLEGIFDSLDFYIVIKDPQTLLPIPTSPLVNSSHLGKYYIVEAIHRCSGNSGWGILLVEDKKDPFLVCRSYIVDCDDDYEPEDVGFPMPVGAPDPDKISDRTYRSTSSLVDNCGPTVMVYRDRLIHVDCPPPVIYIDTVFRDWFAEDAYGNTFYCTDTILVRVGDIGSVICPDNYDNITQAALYCGDSWKTDAQGNPHPDVTGYPTFVHCRNLDFTYLDIKLKVCEGSYKILREWIIADWCTGRQHTCIQVIKVIDDRGPILSCAPNITVSTLSNTCEGEAILNLPTIFKECSAISWDVQVKRGADPNTPPSAIDATKDGVSKYSNTQYKIINLPVGLSWVLFIGTDACGNRDTCASEVFVEEKTRPIAVCDLETVVTLTDDGSAKVYAITFDDGSHDNCEMGGFKVRRMDPGNCPDPIKDDNEFGDYVEFCCSDIPNNPILVVLQVSDKAGNTNECMVRITVQDKKPPVITCLPNITISCEFDRSNLSIFGTYRRSEAERKPINLYDPTNNTFSQPHLWGKDGLVIEDCNLHIDSSVSYSINSCGLGTITRRFEFYDDFNPVQVCEQRITIVDFTKFNGLVSIIWPDHKELEACHPGISPDDAGKPSWPNNTTCSNIIATYNDQVFNIVENVCFKILRTWTVVDWCIYNSNTGAGRWTYTQVIKVKNIVAPTFVSSCTNKSFEGVSNDCNGFATLIAEATDDCQPAQLVYSYEIDLFSNTTIDLSNVGNNASGTYPVGTHRIKWTVTDQCGNSTTCAYDFTILDRKKPSPYCQSGIITVIMPTNGQVTIWASDLNFGSKDNCTPDSRLRFSFSSNPNDASRTYTCSQIPNGVSETFNVRIYVTDEAGNQDYCDTKVIIQDGLGNACPDNIGGGGTTGNLAGIIFNEANSKVENAMVTLNANMANMPKYNVTSPDGQYAFLSLPLNENYIITAQKDDDPLNGVTTQDIVLIQKHILGLQVLSSAYKVIAADVNNSESITAKDVSDLRRLILGVTNEFPNNKSWKFISAKQTFQDITKPWPFNEQNAVDKMSNDLLENNFIAVKMGDVSGNARTNNAQKVNTRAHEDATLNLADLDFNTGDLIKVPVTCSSMDPITGMQLAFDFNDRLLSFIDIESNAVSISEANYSVNIDRSGKILMSWDKVTGLNCDEPLFTLVFKSQKAGKLSNALVLSSELIAEAYTMNSEAINLSLRYESDGKVNNGFYLYQNQPNPFSNSTMIQFMLPEDGAVKITISDVNGRTLKKWNKQCKAGLNSVEFVKDGLMNSGLLYYKIEMNEHKAIRKMLMLE